MNEELKKNAFISVYDKNGIVEFAWGLIRFGWKLMSAGGTYRLLAEQQHLPVVDLGEKGGAPILGHRVMTLSREFCASLLARDVPEDWAELGRLGMPWIDLVCNDFYPLQQTIAKPGVTLAEVVEQIDIGGPNMVRAAAKSGRIVICDPADRSSVLRLLYKGGGAVSPDIRNALAIKAELTVADYCLASARFRQTLALIQRQSFQEVQLPALP